jgi:hypothetical protein
MEIWKNLTKFVPMKKRLIFCSIIIKTLVTIYLATSFTSCANIVPPSGGPRDSIPPYRIKANPIDSAINVQPKEILIQFNEYINTTSLQENVVVSPSMKTNPLIESVLDKLKIRIKDTLLPNTTYSIQFGSAIRDVNEGNMAKDYTYVFSTGNYLDSGKIQGTALLAETGKVDSSLIVLLQPSNNDTAIFKNRPLYYAKINGKGKFSFNYLPYQEFNVFVLPNDYTKKYDDSTKLFAFLDNPVKVSRSKDSIHLFVFQGAKKIEKKKVVNTKALKRNTPSLIYSKSLEGKQLDLLSPLQLSFETPIHLNDSFPIVLADTLNMAIKGFTVRLDNADAQKIEIQYAWPSDTKFHLIVPQRGIKDSLENTLVKNDTLIFTTKPKTAYGSSEIKINGYEQYKNPILFLTQDDKIKFSFPVNALTLKIAQLPPGEFQIKILEDENKNGKWDTGSYGFGKSKKQPEKVWNLPQKLNIRADWDNELNITINK